ncbi:alpha-N-acetylneuraminide alpha-2,8-sialyltransferase-like [Antedon mediterranea]|uniref:alpha-N-acetylneuraminide alpha-2,8-sialyltransferase-like n=1 Tax=Antedon mediterranea TaxID=105859 RepID=UPI003AF5C56C
METSIRLLCLAFATSFLFSTYIWWNIHPYNFDNKDVKHLGLYSVPDLGIPSRQPDKEIIEDHNIPINLTILKDNFKYIAHMSTDSESTLNLSSILMTPWKQNVSNLQQLRSDLKSVVQADMVMSRTNVKKSQRIKCTLNTGTIKIDDRFYKLLQTKDTIDHNTYNRCSIVGNGGILKGSKCGKEIDKADFVIRCNAPPIGQFKEDAGVNSNITTMNPSIITKKFGNLRTNVQQSRFINTIKEYRNSIWFPSFSNSWINRLGITLNNLLNRRLKSLHLIHGNPYHYKEIGAYWAQKGLQNRLSTGFYLTTTALLFCDEVHLYGFWPFSTDIHNRTTSYHYYEDVKISKVVHAFDKEFNELVRLHSEGVLQLHVDDCS